MLLTVLVISVLVAVKRLLCIVAGQAGATTVSTRPRKSAAAIGSSQRLSVVRLVGLLGQLKRWSVV